MKAKKISESETIMTEMIMPNDTNPIGNLMGGNLMRWMDIIGGICAGKHCEAYVVTASVDNVSFQKPIKLGDVITMKATVTRAFNTSVELNVEVSAADIKGGNSRMCNHAFFTFVGINEDTGKPVKIPPVLPINNEQQSLYDGALRRRQIRLILAGRLKPKDATEVKNYFLDL